MFNYFDVNDAVKIRVQSSCEKEGLSVLTISRLSSRTAEHHLYKVLCIKEDKENMVNEYHIYDFNATTHLLYNKLIFNSCREALMFLASKML